MIEKLRSMAVFVRVVETGSFRQAARRLEISAAAVSMHVSQLEAELGVRLLYRSTRHLALTDPGTAFFEYCRGMVENAENALRSVSTEEAGGRLQVVAPTEFAVGPFLRDVAEFCRLHPQVDLRLEFDDQPRNLVRDGIDIALCIGEQRSSSLVARRLAANQPRRIAAPAYLERFGPIRDLEDLRRAQWVVLGDLQSINLRGPQGQTEEVRLNRHISVNNIVALYELTLCGMGVGELPQMLPAADLASGRIVEVLPQWQRDSIACYALFPARVMPKALARAFMDFIETRIRDQPGLEFAVTPDPGNTPERDTPGGSPVA